MKKVPLHPIKYFEQFLLFIDQTFSIFWSLYYWVFLAAFLGTMLHAFVLGDYDRIFHMLALSFIFVNFEMLAGFMQVAAALIIDDSGRKLKYLIFAPFYMLIYWMMNVLTIATTFIPAIKTILGFGTGTWVSPTRVSISKE